MTNLYAGGNISPVNGESVNAIAHWETSSGPPVAPSESGFIGLAVGGEGLVFDGETYLMACVKDGEFQYGFRADGSYVLADAGTNQNSMKSSDRCTYCGTRGGEDKYHEGTCANCGATL